MAEHEQRRVICISLSESFLRGNRNMSSLEPQHVIIGCASLTAQHVLQDGALNQGRRITDREDDYRKRRLARMISPARNDAFAMGDQTPDARVSTYADRMREAQLARERDNTLQVPWSQLWVDVCCMPVSTMHHWCIIAGGCLQVAHSLITSLETPRLCCRTS